MRPAEPIAATFAGLALALALTISAGGCGGAPPEGPASAPAPSQPPPQPPPPQADDGAAPSSSSSEVMIRRTMCYGDCPAYTAFFSGDGSVFYFGRAFVEPLGVRTGTVAAADVAALVDLSERSGYWATRHDYDDGVTDQATVFTALLKDGRRHWVRNYAGGAPPEVAVVETAADALLEFVTWDPSPRLEPAADDACAALGAAIARRCAAVLTVNATGGDCSHWLSSWDSLMTGTNVEASDLGARCARFLRSLERSEAPPTKPHNEIRWGKHCQAWNRKILGACHEGLLAGDPNRAPCAEPLRWTEIQTLAVVRDHYSESSIRASEFFCERWTRD